MLWTKQSLETTAIFLTSFHLPGRSLCSLPGPCGNGWAYCIFVTLAEIWGLTPWFLTPPSSCPLKGWWPIPPVPTADLTGPYLQSVAALSPLASGAWTPTCAVGNTAPFLCWLESLKFGAAHPAASRFLSFWSSEGKACFHFLVQPPCSGMGGRKAGAARKTRLAPDHRKGVSQRTVVGIQTRRVTSSPKGRCFSTAI